MRKTKSALPIRTLPIMSDCDHRPRLVQIEFGHCRLLMEQTDKFYQRMVPEFFPGRRPAVLHNGQRLAAISTTTQAMSALAPLLRQPNYISKAAVRPGTILSQTRVFSSRIMP